VQDHKSSIFLNRSKAFPKTRKPDPYSIWNCRKWTERLNIRLIRAQDKRRGL
jgi:hypothetical protein